MYCKWCGMESEDDKRCTWCGKAIDPSGVTREKAASETRSVSDTGDTSSNDPMEVLGEVLLVDKPDTGETDVYSPLETEKKESKLVRQRSVTPVTPSLRLEKYLSIMLILMALGMLVVHFHKDAWLNQFVPLLFISGLLLGVFEVIPDYHDKLREDVFFLVGMTFLAGPVYGTLVYWLYSSIRQRTSNSLLVLMASYIAIRLGLGFAAHGIRDTVRYLALPNLSLHPMLHVAELIPLVLIGGGWGVSRFVRVFLDELTDEEKTEA